MHILFIVEYFVPHIGGAENLFDSMTKALVTDGYSISIVTSRFDKNLASHEVDLYGRNIYRVGRNRHKFMRHVLWISKHLVRSADIIHTTTYNASIPAWILAKIYNKKIILTVHEIHGKVWKQLVGRKAFAYIWFEKLIFCFSFDRYHCVSYYTYNCLRIYMGINDAKMIVIYPSIDYTIWHKQDNTEIIKQNIRNKLGLGEQDYMLLFMGRTSPVKGLQYLLDAMPAIVSHIPHAKLVAIVTEAKAVPLQTLKQKVATMSITEHIIRGDSIEYALLKQYILSSDVVVVPSLAEGFCFVAVEVCALGHPIVVSQVASLPEVASGKVVFTKPGSVDGLVESILHAYTHSYISLPTREFSLETHTQKLIQIYEDICDCVRD